LANRLVDWATSGSTAARGVMTLMHPIRASARGRIAASRPRTTALRHVVAANGETVVIRRRHADKRVADAPLEVQVSSSGPSSSDQVIRTLEIEHHKKNSTVRRTS